MNISDYSFMAEHTDLRHIMGVGIAITRGSAASLSFCYCLLLLTMSRNLLTKLKEFSIQQYIPLDSHIQVHLKHEYTWTELHDEV
jgi:dual oxidase